MRRRFFRYSALTLALVAIGGQVASGLHFALVHHVTCAEHGELIETGSTAEAPATQTAVSAIAEGHGHDHCSVALLRQPTRSPMARTLPLGAAPSRLTCVIAIRTAPSAPIDLLAFAPKSSPPA